MTKMIIRSRNTPAWPCPNCGAALDRVTAAAPTAEETIPTTGQLTVCSHCRMLLEFAPGGYRLAAPARLADLHPQARQYLECELKGPIRVAGPAPKEPA